jgi:DNA-binding transcriptional LysR family regulator
MQQSSIDLDGLRSFLAVADRLTFHEAAVTLGISAPALTRRIQRFETALDTALLERSTRQVVLTAEGRLFLPLARAAVEAVDTAVAAVRKAARERADHLSLACLPTLSHHLLPRILRDFHARRPEIHVRVTECGATQIADAVRDGSASFGFGFRLAGGAASDLAFETLLRDPYCLILPPGHELAAQKAVRWPELKPHKVITAGRQSGNMQVLDEALHGIDWRPETAYEIDHLRTSLGLVEAGLGIAVVPQSALPVPLPPTLAVRPLVEPEATRSLGIFRRRGATLPAVAQQFLRTARRTAAALREGG